MAAENSSRPKQPDTVNEAGQNLKSPAPNPGLTPQAATLLLSSTNLPDEVWDWLLKDAERFAAKQIHQYRWRGAKGGVLPGGFDANSIAAQAIIEFLQPDQARTGHRPVDQAYLSEGSNDFPCSRPPRTTAPDLTDPDLDVSDEPPKVREPKFPPGWESECRILRAELHHGVRRVVNRLWHLKERVSMHNVEDLVPVQPDDGEPINLIETLPDRASNPQESLIDRQTLAAEQQFQEQFHSFLAKDRALQTTYAYLCNGVSTRRELASKLKVSPATVKNRLRRLKRRAETFSGLNSSEEYKNRAKKVVLQVIHIEGLAEAA